MKKIRICKRITAEGTILRVGATIILARTATPILNLIKEKYLEDNSCIEGDIEALFEAKGTGKGKNDYLYR